MKTLADFLRSAKSHGKPVFGICFGHQMLAHAHGAEVRKSDNGWGVGAQPYAFGPESGIDGFNAMVFHQDQVESLPAGATRIAGNDHCPIGALAYDFPAMSVQFHPEFSKPFMEALVNGLRGTLISNKIAEQALSSMEAHAVQSETIARAAAAFFTSNHAG